MKSVAMAWLKQTADKPLFPEILWSRPENRHAAGELLIVGGNKNSFKSPADAFAAAEKAGAGSVRVLLPESLRRALGHGFGEAVFAASTPSGSFARLALAEFLSLAEWSDLVLLAGDFGHNSETAILMEAFLQKYDGRVVLSGDSLDYFKGGRELIDRPETLAVGPLTAIQKLIATRALRHDQPLQQLVDELVEITKSSDLSLLIEHEKMAIVASGGQISTTPTEQSLAVLTARASVFWLQNPSKKFEAITASLLE